MNITVKLTIGLAILHLARPAPAQDLYELKSGTMTVSGTSSLHDWESAVTQIEWRGFVSNTNNTLSGIQDATIKIPVKSIKSTKGKTMDNKTYEAFHSEKNPFIIFTLTACEVSGSSIMAKGKLSMAGKSKAIELNIKSKQLSGSEIQLQGSSKINMLDYAMEPPTAMMGAIKVGEEVTINFDLTIEQSNKNSRNN